MYTHSSCIRLMPRDDKGKIYTISSVFSHFIRRRWERDEGANAGAFRPDAPICSRDRRLTLEIKNTRPACKSSDSLASGGGGLFFSSKGEEKSAGVTTASHGGAEWTLRPRRQRARRPRSNSVSCSLMTAVY